MPQIGWFEILIVVVIAVLVIGPKDFPIVLKKIGNWVGSVKSYFSEIQKSISDVESIVDDDTSIKSNNITINKNKKKDE